jgi:hypothetical protein
MTEKRGLVFTFSVFFIFLALFGLITALTLRKDMLASDTVDDVTALKRFYAEEELAMAFFSVAGITDVLGSADASTRNITFMGRMDLSEDAGTALVSYLDFFDDELTHRTHLSLLWINPVYRFVIRPYGTDISVGLENVSGFTEDYQSLERIDVTLEFSDAVSVTPWADAGGSYPVISIRVIDNESNTVYTRQRDPAGAFGTFEAGSIDVRFGNETEEGTFRIEGGAVNVTRLSFVYNQTDGPVWAETAQNVTFTVGTDIYKKYLRLFTI